MDNVYMKGSKILVEANIAGKPLDFHIDTGADVSLVNEQSWNCLGQPKLATTTEHVIYGLRQMFACFGMPRATSDNGKRQRTSSCY